MICDAAPGLPWHILCGMAAMPAVGCRWSWLCSPSTPLAMAHLSIGKRHILGCYVYKPFYLFGFFCLHSIEGCCISNKPLIRQICLQKGFKQARKGT